jgi:hypothetical protein
MRIFKEIVDSVNERLEGFEMIKKFTLLSKELTVESDELTPTLKVKRRVIDLKFKILSTRCILMAFAETMDLVNQHLGSWANSTHEGKLSQKMGDSLFGIR